MDLEQVKNFIGRETYAAASAAARTAAPTTGKEPLGDLEPFVIAVPMEIGDMICEADLSVQAKIQLLFEVYTDIPSTSLLFTLLLTFEEFSPRERALFWQHVRKLISQPNPIWSQPLAYMLWCDFFEYSRRVEEAWTTLITEDPAPLLVERILDVSGPVPFAWKQALYARLIGDPHWHPAIFRSLLFSRFDAYGQIDQAAAYAILKQLRLPADTPNLHLLEETLSRPESAPLHLSIDNQEGPPAAK
jgi:hypothetical protein